MPEKRRRPSRRSWYSPEGSWRGGGGGRGEEGGGRKRGGGEEGRREGGREERRREKRTIGVMISLSFKCKSIKSLSLPL